MGNSFAKFKEKLAEKHPNGATNEDINKFCDEYPELCSPLARKSFTTYIIHAGE